MVKCVSYTSMLSSWQLGLIQFNSKQQRRLAGVVALKCECKCCCIVFYFEREMTANVGCCRETRLVSHTLLTGTQ